MSAQDIIIIRRGIRQVAEQASVVNKQSEPQLQEMLRVLTKQDADWTDGETHYVLRCIGRACESC